MNGETKIMILFLTSSPTGDLDGRYVPDGIDNRNGFCDTLRTYWKENTRCLIATASPDDRARSHEFADFLFHAFEKSNLSCVCVDVLDRDTMYMSGEEIRSYDLIVMGGGHVPTQNAFFKEIGLREKLQGYEGIIIGISAGTMNCADIVYAQPEEEGEAVDPNYQRFIPGLGLTDINVLPHYQIVKDYILDGLRIFEDITYGDSYGKNFIALPDGSYIVKDGSFTRICGQAWRVYPHGLEPIG